MSNRVDYFRGEVGSLSVPAGRGFVFVDGVLCPLLEVKEIVRASGPDYGLAVLAYNPALWTEGDRVAAERIESVAAMGKGVRIVMPYDAGFGRTQVEGLCVFAGQVEKMETVIGPDVESVEIVVRDFAARLGRITVYGQRVSDSLSLAGRATVFNEGDQPNASESLVQHGGRAYRIFAADEREASYWTVAEAMAYLLYEYVAAGQLGVPGVEQLEGVFGDRAAGEIDVDGMSVLEALEACCEGTGVRFRFEACQEEGAPAERIVFFGEGVSRKVELNLQRAGEKLSVSRTNVCRLASEREYWPFTQRYIGRGGWKVYEAVFDLVAAWDSSLEGLSQGEYSQSASSDFEAVRDVYRRWCLNEGGDYSSEAFDFRSVFERAEFVQRHRRFLETAVGGYLLEVSYDGGATWGEYSGSYDVLNDECGVWISDDELSSEVWTAIGAGTLRFRIQAAVESDQRLTVSVADGPVGSCAEVVDRVIDLGEYGYRKAYPAGVLRDDSAAMHGHLRGLCETNRAVIETIDIETPTVNVHYRCGDRVVCSPDSRDVLGIRRDSRSEFWIERAVADFQRQYTRLRVLRRRQGTP